MARRVAVFCIGVSVLSVGCGDESSPQVGPTGRGSVGVFQLQGSDGAVQTAMTASFQPEQVSSCRESRDGACVRRDCVWEHAPDASNFSAGLITATSGGRQLSVEPEIEKGVYPSEFLDFQLEGTIRVEAEGGDDISPFQAEILAPKVAVVVEPPPATNVALIHRRGQPLFVAWEESEAGEMLVIASFMHGREYGSVSCEFPASEGGANMSAELLESFNPNGAAMRLTLGIRSSDVLLVDGFEIEIVGYASAVTIDGRSASFAVESR